MAAFIRKNTQAKKNDNEEDEEDLALILKQS